MFYGLSCLVSSYFLQEKFGVSRADFPALHSRREMSFRHTSIRLSVLTPHSIPVAYEGQVSKLSFLVVVA